MSEQTKIEWADATWNPWIGCTKVSPGCANCFAAVSTFTRAKRAHGVELWGRGAKRHRTSVEYWKKPHVWNRAPRLAPGTPRPRIVPSLCDWLDDEAPVESLAYFLHLIDHTPNLDWLLLSKHPELWRERLMAVGKIAENWNGLDSFLHLWLDGQPPNNVWIGTSVEDQQRADERIPELLKIPARVRFLSVEPLLGPVDLLCRVHQRGAHYKTVVGTNWLGGSAIQWVIVGGESGPKARPCNVAWVRDIVRQCREAGVPCFVKQLGSNPTVERWPKAERDFSNFGRVVDLALKHPKGGDPSEWPEDLRVREFPEVVR